MLGDRIKIILSLRERKMFGEEFKSTERKLRSQENKNAWRA